MKKLLLLIFFIISTICSSAFALDKTNAKVVLVELYGEYLSLSQKDMYDFVYDEKKQAMFNFAMTGLDEAGIKPEYFVDDYKKSADCYAQKFAENITVDDFKSIYSNRTVRVAKNAIINNLSNKFQTSCIKKHHPYLTGNIDDLMKEYFRRRCGDVLSEEKKSADCLDKMVKDMVGKLN